jgi:hypothetical protein
MLRSRRTALASSRPRRRTHGARGATGIPAGQGGGDDGTRTHDPLLAKQVLFQLSYIPIENGLWPAAILLGHLRGTLRLASMTASSVDLPASFERYLRAENKSARTVATYLEAVVQLEGCLGARGRTWPTARRRSATTPAGPTNSAANSTGGNGPGRSHRHIPLPRKPKTAKRAPPRKGAPTTEEPRPQPAAPRVRTGRSASGCNEDADRRTRPRTLPDS